MDRVINTLKSIAESAKRKPVQLELPLETPKQPDKLPPSNR